MDTWAEWCQPGMGGGWAVLNTCKLGDGEGMGCAGHGWRGLVPAQFVGHLPVPGVLTSHGWDPMRQESPVCQYQYGSPVLIHLRLPSTSCKTGVSSIPPKGRNERRFTAS